MQMAESDEQWKNAAPPISKSEDSDSNVIFERLLHP
jgi:hypothetical protein